jgi:putative ABC transport system permease protein
MRLYNAYIHDIAIAFDAILSNKLRSILTALGIIFGVAAVITMLAIGKGAQQEILEQIKMVGVNNIVIFPLVEQDNDQNTGQTEDATKKKKKLSKGLTLADVTAIQSTLSTVKLVSPEVIINSFAYQNGTKFQTKLLGVNDQYFNIYNLDLEKGAFFDQNQEEKGLSVCVVGANIPSKFFPQTNPIGQYIKFGKNWLRIVGVLNRNNIKLSGYQNAGVNVINDNIFIPIKAFLLRYQDRALVNARKVQEANRRFGDNNNTKKQNKNYHQIDKIVIQVKETEDIQPTVEVLSRMMLRRHSEVTDYEITVPELLLKQQQRTKEIFNFVLGAIASISLIVGGIGIMNIMFASVMERIKEIGTRMAIGAKKKDIVVQFLSEAVLISVTGGIIGVFLGVITSILISKLLNIMTIISPFSVLIAFAVSVGVGVIFGYSPAKRASERDPIESLRYE